MLQSQYQLPYLTRQRRLWFLTDELDTDFLPEPIFFFFFLFCPIYLLFQFLWLSAVIYFGDNSSVSTLVGVQTFKKFGPVSL